MTHAAENGAELELFQIGKSYGSQKVLADVNLHVAPGEFVTFLGPSGSGKTTTLNLIAGFVDPDLGGRIKLDGRDLSGIPAHKRGIGVVFQNYALFPHKSVRENIAFPLLQRRPRPDSTFINKRVNEALSLVHMEPYADRRPDQLSGGQQQRVALARAVVFQPKLLLLDEPLGALDKRLRQALQLELRRIHRELGVTMIFVTHDQEEALTLSDRIVVFREGAVEQVDTPQELYNNPKSEFVATFLGDSNIFSGQIKGGELTVDGSEGRFVPQPAESNGGVTVMVRPEKIHVTRAMPEASGRNTLPVTITDMIFAGATVRIEAQGASGVPLIAQIGSVDSGLMIGTKAWFAWEAEATRIVARESSRTRV